MPIGMPFSFVQFNTVEDAINALELIHYKPCADLEDRVLYAGFYPDQIVINEIIDFNYHVPGLVYHDEFITLEEENEMLSAIESYEGWGIVKGRHVKHFGYEFSYKIKHVGLKMDPFPNFVVPALHRFYKAYPQYHTMDQLTISSYPVGSGIPPHCDSHTAFHNTILIISLKNQIVMEFRKPSTGEVGHRLLKPRSLVIIGGESRYGWEHSIKLRKSDPLPDGQLMERKERLSLTFRKIQNEPGCGCLFKDLCDIDYYKKIRESQITFNK
ncbi:hypothetical protein K502DRAFT_301787 [Neoconidiobolus thromboides FSU 785]|nr:hypothetical protein K502DRAFT_301787 [Neoconidiobolus thromboides FSU 785]